MKISLYLNVNAQVEQGERAGNALAPNAITSEWAAWSVADGSLAILQAG